jgi:hypothetical protein
MLIICGFLTGIDKYGRLEFMYPRVRCGLDMYGTEAKLAAVPSPGGYSPLKSDGFHAKPWARTLYLDVNGRTVKAVDLQQQMVKIEAQPQEYQFDDKKGWYLKIHSCRVLKQGLAS